jgi:hypothetical protein
MKVQLAFLECPAIPPYDLELSPALIRELRTSLAMKLVETPDLLKIQFQRPSERTIRAAAAILWANQYAELSKNALLTEQAREDIKQLTLRTIPESAYYFEHRRFRPGASQRELDLGKFIWTLRDRADLGSWLLYSWLHIISPLKHGGDPDRYADPSELRGRAKPALQAPVWTRVVEIQPMPPPPAPIYLKQATASTKKSIPPLSQDGVVRHLEMAYQRTLGMSRPEEIKRLSDPERWEALERALSATLTLPTRYESKIPPIFRQWYRAKLSQSANLAELQEQVATILGIRSVK